MKDILKTNYGKIINGDNLEILDTIDENSIDSCISDFPYDLSFMGKKWDNTGNFYSWCKDRAEKLYPVMKHGGYVAIFGHPKTNHKMKCAFEDVGFNIVEEIDWIYLTGMPKNQDVRKLFGKQNNTVMAEKWNGWKTSGLKPAHEPITIFQKPLQGKYVQNIENYGCGCMNIDACRVPMSREDINMLNAKASKNTTTNYSDREDRVYGKYAEDKAMPANELGRFPSNVIYDEYVAQLIDIGDSGKIFPVIKYNQKVTPKERKLPNDERNPHVTLKPVELIKWLIKLLTPVDGTTIDITAGSCTHAVACEELNKKDGYKLNYIDIELMNIKEEPYCEVGKMRVLSIIQQTNGNEYANDN